MAPVTMTDVARAAGVSAMTVSNVINGRPRVGAETRLRVLEVIDELGYEVNLTARRLRAGRTGTVALVVPHFDHPYFGELAARFAAAFIARGKHLVVAQSGASAEGELSALSPARLQMYDGVLLSVVGMHHEEVERIRAQVPIVLLGEQTMPERFDHLGMANVEGAALATRHLLERGARRVALVGGGPPSTHNGMSELRSEGWRAAHREAGLVPDENLVVRLPRLEPADARTGVLRALGEGLQIDAAFAVTDQVAYGVLAALHDAGMRVPEDVAVVGFDDLALSAHVVPGLSSIDPANDWLVENAVRLLERRMADPDAQPEHLTGSVDLVVRGSSR